MERRTSADTDPGTGYIHADPAFAILRDRIRRGERVLDVGCGFGNVGAYLAGAGAIVDGVEPDPTRSAAAAERLHHVHRVPLEEVDPPDAGYDTVLLIDVVEHFTSPTSALTTAASLVRDGGRIFVFIPNSAHYSFRKKILRGDWSYADWGLFDRTHLRFFDIDTAQALIDGAGFATVQRWCTTPASDRISRIGVRVRPNLFALHFLFEIRRAAKP